MIGLLTDGVSGSGVSDPCGDPLSSWMSWPDRDGGVPVIFDGIRTSLARRVTKAGIQAAATVNSTIKDCQRYRGSEEPPGKRDFQPV